MKYKSIFLCEHIPIRLCKYFTGLFAKKNVNWCDFSSFLDRATYIEKELSASINHGLIENLLYSKPHVIYLDIPDVEKAYNLYRFLLSIDQSLLMIFRGYHLRMYDDAIMKKKRKELVRLSVEVRNSLGGSNG